MLLLFFPLVCTLMYTSDSFINSEKLSALSPQSSLETKTNQEKFSTEEQEQDLDKIKIGAVDSAVSSDIEDGLSFKDNSGSKTIEKQSVKTDIKNIETLLKKEMEELSPEVNGRIASSIKSSNVDRSKYRDIFVIKKRIVSDGTKQIVTFDIKEKLIPKILGYAFNNDSYTKALFVCILILLLSLVLTTSIRVYQTIFADKFGKQLCGMELPQ
ncbi:hypothetical protein PAEPH01_0175 [Pancytospora epiphaga]|nr:hypothetical protein PAEPH01_0175 [Pancytospora epiphaga]